MGCLASDPTVAALAGLPPPPDLAGQPPNDVGASLLPSFLSPSSQPEPGRDYAFSEYPQCPGEHPGHLGQATVGGFGNYWHTDRGCQGTDGCGHTANTALIPSGDNRRDCAFELAPDVGCGTLNCSNSARRKERARPGGGVR